MQATDGCGDAELKYSEEAIELSLAPSPLAAAGLAAMALATFAVLLATPGAAAARILLATAVACGALECAHGLGLGRAARRRALRLRASDEIEVRSPGGHWRRGCLRAGSFVAPWITLLLWRAEGSRFDRAVLILPDMLGEEEFRRLRVWLRWA
jgi:hypothetical protein